MIVTLDDFNRLRAPPHKLLATLAKTEVLILDDWGLANLMPEHQRDLLEILEDRHGARSTLATSQLPIDQ